MAGAAPMRWLPVALAVTAIALGVGVAVKAPCLFHEWDGYQYTQRCYNDLIPLYTVRHLGDPSEVPYASFVPPADGASVDSSRGFNEYPTLTGLAQYLAARVSVDGGTFFVATAILLGLCALAVTVLLERGGARPAWLVGWAVAPPLALYAFHNWDLLAVALATGGLVARRRGHPATSGALLALGASAKIYPALFLVLVGCDLLRVEGGLRRAGWRFGLAAAATFVVVQGPFLLLNVQGWFATYQFHLLRGVTVETPWAVLGHWAEGAPGLQTFFEHTLPAAASVLFVALLAVLGHAVAKGRLALMHACLAAVALFLLLNKVHSVQYALWVMPLLALAEVRWWAWFPYLLGDALVFWTIWPFFHELDTGGDSWLVFTIAVLVRAAGQAILAVAAVRAGWRPSAPVRATLSDVPQAQQEPLL